MKSEGKMSFAPIKDVHMTIDDNSLHRSAMEVQMPTPFHTPETWGMSVHRSGERSDDVGTWRASSNVETMQGLEYGPEKETQFLSKKHYLEEAPEEDFQRK
jgi:hypothetical protein